MIEEYDDGYASRDDFEREWCDTEESLREPDPEDWNEEDLDE